MPRASHPLEAVLGHDFVDQNLLAEALTHSSHGPAIRKPTYERLEFLGDRVLGLVVAEMLLNHFPGEEEGALARRHSALVMGETLARIGGGIGLSAHVIMSRGEDEAGGRNKPNLLADVLEAVIAALYLDGGLEVAAEFIKKHWRPLMDGTPTPPQDAKTALQEWVQGQGKPLPDYELMSRTGPDHVPLFTVRARAADAQPETATGPSKRAAEQAAAKAVLIRAGVWTKATNGPMEKEE
jgi:ribonuclease-3